MKTLKSILAQFGTFILLEIDLQGHVLHQKFNNTPHKLTGIRNIKEIFGKREQEQIAHDIYYKKKVESILKTSKQFGSQTVKINTSEIEKEKRYVLINFAKTFGEKDMTQRKYIESLIQESELDPMTKTLNRRGAWRRIEEMLKKTSIQHLGIIFVDIDGLKQINDKKGHLHGDKAIIQISRLLKNSVRKSDIVVRFGGDEFIIIVEEKSSRRSASRGITRRILKTIREGRFITTVSVGLHVIDTREFLKSVKRGKDLQTRWGDELKKADAAVYSSKEDGRATYNTTEAFKDYFDA